MNKALLAAIVLSGFLLVGMQPFQVAKAQPPRTIVVPDDYSSIQAAINDAAAGSTVFIKKGYYVENPVVEKSLFLVGEDRETTVLDVTGGLRVAASNVTITGLTLYDGWSGISLTAGANYCNISGNKITGSSYGIIVDGEGNSITGNIFKSIGTSSAIQLNGASNNRVSNNSIESCVEGIQILDGSSNNVITENTIIDCSDMAIRFKHASYNTLTHNSISHCGCGTSIYASNKNQISSNDYFGNAVQFSADEWYYIAWGGSPSVNTIDRNYWSNYNGTDADNDGVGDTPYIIDSSNQDDNPLTSPTRPEPPAPTQTPPSTLTASLSESASALNNGNPINFTVSTDGGVAPYNFTWYIDGQVAAITGSSHYSTSSLLVGSHHAYVQVTDASGNSANTLTVGFNVLPSASQTYSPSPSQQPTQTPPYSPTATPTSSSSLIQIQTEESTQSPNPTPNTASLDGLPLVLIASSAAIIASIAAVAYFRKQKMKTRQATGS